MPTTPSETPQISQSQRTDSVDELDLLVDSYLTLTRIPTWRQPMTTNGRWQRETPHYCTCGNVHIFHCTCRNCEAIRIELVRDNHSNSDRNAGHDGEPKDYSYDHKKKPPPQTWPPTCQYNPQVPCICWGYEIPCPHKERKTL